MKVLTNHANLFVLGLCSLIGVCGNPMSVQAAPAPQDQAEVKSDADKSELPPFKTVKGVIERAFAKVPEWQPGRLVTKSQVEDVCSDVRLLGWKSFNQKAVLSDVLADNAFLAKELRTDKGKVFMGKISALPDAYDKLDRLSRMPQGRKTVHALINGVGGDELIVYLTTASGGEELGKMLGATPKGHDFNEPTGLIYTAEQFLARAEAEYEQELAKQNHNSSK